MRSRSTHVRTKVVALLLSLIALWAFAAYVTVRDGLNLLWVSVIYTNVGQPTDVVVQALSEERRLSLIFVGGGDAGVKASLITARTTTDQAVADLIELSQASSVDLAAPDALEQQIVSFKDELAILDRTRRSIDQRNVGLIQASSGFDAIVDSAFVVNRSLANFDDAELAKDARTLVNVVYAREILAREDAFMSGALAAGSISASDRAQFGQMVGTRRYLHASVRADLSADARTRLGELLAGSTYVRFTSAEDAIMTASNTSALPISAESWRGAADAILLDFREFEVSAVDEVLARAQPAAIGTIVRLALAGVLGLVAVIASIVISITTARKLVRQLERLRNAARELASYRLPRVVERLQHGERVDIEAEAPPLDFGRDEIGQVGEAFNQVQETAIRVAVEQAELRRSVRDVFLSLARRSQALLHRQLGLLDAMERRATDAGTASRAVPRRPPGHPHASQRREPDRALRCHRRPGLAQASAHGRRAAGCARRGRGLHAGHGGAGRLGVTARPGSRRRHPPAGRADRERGVVLAAADGGSGRRVGCRLRVRHRDRGPRPRHERRGARDRQRAAAQPAGVPAHHAPPDSGCTWSASWPSGTGSGSGSPNHRTAARLRSCCCLAPSWPRPGPRRAAVPTRASSMATAPRNLLEVAAIGCRETPAATRPVPAGRRPEHWRSRLRRGSSTALATRCRCSRRRLSPPGRQCRPRRNPARPRCRRVRHLPRTRPWSRAPPRRRPR